MSLNTYNGDGYRVEKTVNGAITRYLYEYDKVVLELDGTGNQTGRNVYGTNLLMRSADGTTYYYMYNGHADVTALLKPDGTIAATYYYDAFGNITDTTGAASNTITFAGYQYDKETGLYYLNARMYDPNTARFLQEDTYTGDRNDPLSLNLYTYCHNEPLMYSDPTGHITRVIMDCTDAQNYYRDYPVLKAQMKNGISDSLEAAYNSSSNEIDHLRSAKAEIDRTSGVNAVAESPHSNITKVGKSKIKGKVKSAHFDNKYLDDVYRTSFDITWKLNMANDTTPYQVTRPFTFRGYNIMKSPSNEKTLNTMREIFGEDSYQAYLERERQYNHQILGAVGYFSDVVDIGDGILYFSEGDYSNARWSLAAAIPFLGAAAKPLRKVIKRSSEVVSDSVRVAEEVSKVGEGTSNLTKGIDFVEDTGRLGGKLYSEKKLGQLSKYLDKRGINLDINDEFLNSKGANGGFDAVEGKLILRSDATEYEVRHELSHYIQYKQLGKEKYLNLPRTTDFNAPEQFVFDMLENNKRRWYGELNEAERNHASWYIYKAGGLR